MFNIFNFSPTDGLKNTQTYETYPATESRTREILQTPLDQIRVFINNLISIFNNKTVGESGAEQVGSAPITGVTGDTVHTQLSNLKYQLDNTIQGAVSDSSITENKLATNSVTTTKIADNAVDSNKIADNILSILKFSNIKRDIQGNIILKSIASSTNSTEFSVVNTTYVDTNKVLNVDLTNVYAIKFNVEMKENNTNYTYYYKIVDDVSGTVVMDVATGSYSTVYKTYTTPNIDTINLQGNRNFRLYIKGGSTETFVRDYKIYFNDIIAEV